MKKGHKVGAAIVTFNRLNLLKQAIRAVKAQTRTPDELIIVNNGSTDGTTEWLQTQSSVTVINQTNLGGAGGFQTAIYIAWQRNLDWIWLMDDDGFPHKNALRMLCGHLADDISALCSVVINLDQPALLAFSYPKLDSNGFPVILFARKRALRTLAEIRRFTKGNLISGVANFFNGALINLNLAKKIGNVDTRFFIYGDEVDFFYRLKKVGRILTVLSSYHFHPRYSGIKLPDWKAYYALRNSLYINSVHLNRPLLRNAYTIAASLSTWLIQGKSPRLFLSAVRDGLTKRLGIRSIPGGPYHK